MSKTFNHTILRIKNSEGLYDGLPALRGLNSYELAVQFGFEGTEEEWMESLIGSGWIGSFQELEAKHNTLAEQHDHLANKVVAITPQILTGTLPIDGWTENNGIYEYTLAFENLYEDPESVMVDIDLSEVTDASDMTAINEAWGAILKCTVVSEGNLYFAFSEQPAIVIPIKVEVING